MWLTLWYASGGPSFPTSGCQGESASLGYVVGRLKAWWLLAWALVATLLSRLLGNQPSLPKFRAQYDAERLPALRPGELVVLRGLGRCIACGLCDRGESERVGEAHGGYPGLMTLVLSAVRSTTDLGAAAHAFAHLSSEILAEKERDCPTSVPFRELGDYVARKSAELGGPWPVPSSVVPPPSAYP